MLQSFSTVLDTSYYKKNLLLYNLHKGFIKCELGQKMQKNVELLQFKVISSSIMRPCDVEE